MPDYSADSGPVRCSFCGKPRAAVQKLIVRREVGICDACIDLCADVLDQELGDWRKQIVDPIRSAKQLADPPPEHRGQVVERLPDGSLAVPALEALVESGYGVRSGMSESGLWAVLKPDHPSYGVFLRYREDYERERSG